MSALSPPATAGTHRVRCSVGCGGAGGLSSGSTAGSMGEGTALDAPPAPARTLKATVTRLAQMFVARRITIDHLSLRGYAGARRHEREKGSYHAAERNDCRNRSEVHQLGSSPHPGAECVLGGKNSQNQC